MYSRPCALFYFRCFPIVNAYIVSIVAKREVGVCVYTECLEFYILN